MGLKPIDIGHCICLGQYEHLHPISYNQIFIGLGIGRCHCEHTLRFKTNAFRNHVIVFVASQCTHRRTGIFQVHALLTDSEMFFSKCWSCRSMSIYFSITAVGMIHQLLILFRFLSQSVIWLTCREIWWSRHSSSSQIVRLALLI